MPFSGLYKKNTSLRLTILFLFVFLVLLFNFSQSAEANEHIIFDADQPAVSLPDEALIAPDTFQMARPLSKDNRKLDQALTSLDSRIGRNGLNGDGLRIEDGLVQVRLDTAAGQIETAAQVVKNAGGIVSSHSELQPVLQAWIPVDRVPGVASDPSVNFVGRPSRLVEFNIAAQTEGLSAMNGDVWQQAGYRGHNIRVAIIDGGFSGYRGLLGSQFPTNTVVKNFVDGENDSQVDGTSPHGTACAEIVADIVPDAQLYLLKINTDLDLEQAVNYAISQGVDVISTSVGWYNLTPGDGTGYFADLVNKAQANGIVWFTAAGNDRESHWGGLFNDPDGNGFHNFSGSQEVNYFGPGNGNAYLLNPGFSIPVFLRWDDWSQHNEDYMLYVRRWNGSERQVIGTSDRPQIEFDLPPTESVVVTTSGGTAPYGYAIQRRGGGRNVNLDIFTPKMPRLDELVYERSLANLADAANVITMGAVDSISPYTFESYSAQGPTNGLGGSLNGGIIKPDFSAYAGVSTESYGPGVFAGTSAAAPHAAGAAALILDGYETFSPQEVENFMITRAIDQGPIGQDTQYGHGRLYLGAPPNPTAELNFKAYMPASLNP